MRHRIAAATLLVVALPAALSAQQGRGAQQGRATFVLSDGERLTGTVVFHPESQRGFPDERPEFNLRVQNGTEIPISLDQVTVIDFMGGQPRMDELEAAPSDAHLLTMRNGTMRRGRLVDFIWGDTVRWETARGVFAGIPMNQVRRIYVNGDRARELYRFAGVPGSSEDYSARTPVGRNPRLPARAPRPAVPLAEVGAVTVSPREAWTDSGITVRRGDVLIFDPSGTVQFSGDRKHVTGPEGSNARAGREVGLPLPSAPVGSLMGRIGQNGAPFAIGAGTNDIEIPANGRLFLGVNDDGLHDNSGAFEVVIYR